MISLPRHIMRLQKYADKPLLGTMAILTVISFAAAFSTSSNLVNTYRQHDPYYYLMKHMLLIIIATAIFLFTTTIPYRLYQKYRYVIMGGVMLLLLYTDLFGQAAGHEGARRWIRLGILSIQPSIIALTLSLVFTAAFLDKQMKQNTTFTEDLKSYWLWLLALTGLVVIYNNSTAVLIFALNMMLLFLGGYAFKKLWFAFLMSLALLFVYFLAAKAFPQYIPNRIDTAIKRVKRFVDEEENPAKNQLDIQPLRAKIAIASGKLIRFAPGKSVQKNLLSQSSSDFIYAILIEEYGLIFGGFMVLLLYFILAFRILGISRMSREFFQKVLVIAVGLPIIFQALINMSVSAGLIPVTGQPLPILSAGGTTLFMTAFALGVVIQVSMQIRKNQDEQAA